MQNKTVIVSNSLNSVDSLAPTCWPSVQIVYSKWESERH